MVLSIFCVRVKFGKISVQCAYEKVPKMCFIPAFCSRATITHPPPNATTHNKRLRSGANSNGRTSAREREGDGEPLLSPTPLFSTSPTKMAPTPVWWRREKCNNDFNCKLCILGIELHESQRVYKRGNLQYRNWTTLLQNPIWTASKRLQSTTNSRKRESPPWLGPEQTVDGTVGVDCYKF